MQDADVALLRCAAASESGDTYTFNQTESETNGQLPAVVGDTQSCLRSACAWPDYDIMSHQSGESDGVVTANGECIFIKNVEWLTAHSPLPSKTRRNTVFN